MNSKMNFPLAINTWRFSLRIKLIFGFSLMAVIGSLIAAIGFYTTVQNQVNDEFKNRLLGIIKVAALQQNGDEFSKISSAQDPLYEKFRLQNIKIRDTSPDIVFVYTMRKDEQGIFFVVDAGEIGGEDFSAFNDLYSEPSQTLVDNFDVMNEAIVEPEFYTDEYGTFLSAYAPIFSSDGVRVGALGVDIQATTVTQQQKVLNFQAFLVFLAAVTFGIFFGSLAGNALTKPVLKLTQGALAFASGDLSRRIEDTNTLDEISELAKTFNIMAGKIEDLVNNLEVVLSDRTRAIERRDTLLKAVSDVGRSITMFRDLSDLLQQTAYLINEIFGYYHVGIFLLDEDKKYAVLSASNSEGGQIMLKKKHRLKVGETGIVGFVTQSAKARIALDVGKDAVYFDNPDLPQTRSEMALPLVISGKILGALDVQSTESQAFSEEDISTLQILAEQLAIAIRNATLFAENEQALESARISYSQVTREAWSKIIRNQRQLTFIATPPNTSQKFSESKEPSLVKAYETGDIIIGNDNLSISLPVKIRGQIIGSIRLKKTESSEGWTQEETKLAIALSDQLGGALESARLYRESQQRGARESLVSDISARISAISNTDNILRETVQELGQTLGNASVSFQLIEQINKQNIPPGGEFLRPINQAEQSKESNNNNKALE